MDRGLLTTESVPTISSLGSSSSSRRPPLSRKHSPRLCQQKARKVYLEDSLRHLCCTCCQLVSSYELSSMTATDLSTFLDMSFKKTKAFRMRVSVKVDS